MVREHMEKKSHEEREEISKPSIHHMFGKQNIKLAIQKVKKGTVPGRDGFPTEFYSEDEEVLDRMAGHLSRLFLEITKDKDMTQAMKCAIVSILYKGKGKDKTEADSYRPISITPAEYRVMTKAIQIKLQPIAEILVGKTQMAYLGDGRQMRDSKAAMTGGIRSENQQGEERGDRKRREEKRKRRSRRRRSGEVYGDPRWG